MSNALKISKTKWLFKRLTYIDTLVNLDFVKTQFLKQSTPDQNSAENASSHVDKIERHKFSGYFCKWYKEQNNILRKVFCYRYRELG
jgi:hypothetical protein